MAKPKSPLLSLGARGTIADSLTFQKRGLEHIVREKPVPTDPYSLAQAYQRWDYRDYAYRWTLLSNSEKQVYRTKASRYHITGFSQWMREQLNELTNLVARYHLDERSGAVAFDTSRNAYNATIFGATPAPGLIDRSYYFDGINDYMRSLTFAAGGELNVDNITLEAFVYLSQLGAQRGLIDIFVGANHSAVLRVNAANKIQALWWNTLGAAQVTTGNTALLIDTWYHAAFTLEGSEVIIYLDGAIDKQQTKADTLRQGSDMIDLGRYAGASWLKGYLDHIAIHNALLDITEIKRHAERRYPV